ncbi:expressed hypothetical protein [Trichoplax adhaerens]|uniref:Translocon-associated protein subunit beta n=1 Tax=Trichoplax adhaerens TaxID=10228 RepID=B3SAU5_TRIAD|nr:expressed hypothetical protein [Trichoplax adhaerens]EDV20164.1 expressed hypothetical protein [Trichoplax adhaerens]|eukprot:XP_002117325.1 expressed hypothetical protein [Trichoplax adhaerens]
MVRLSEHSRKNVLNNMVVENKELVINYEIYNVGQGTATEVELQDDIISGDSMKLVRGILPVVWDRIPPGGNVTHAVVLKPIKVGPYNFTSARISYTMNENGDRQLSLSTALGVTSVMNEKEYDRKHSPHLTDWAIFGLLNIPIIVIPYLMWYSSKSKYYTPKAKKA